MKKCKDCSDVVEAEVYDYCYGCWWVTDPRNKRKAHAALDLVWSTLCKLEMRPMVEGQRDQFQVMRKHLTEFTEYFKKSYKK